MKFISILLVSVMLASSFAVRVQEQHSLKTEVNAQNRQDVIDDPWEGVSLPLEIHEWTVDDSITETYDEIEYVLLSNG